MDDRPDWIKQADADKARMSVTPEIDAMHKKEIGDGGLKQALKWVGIPIGFSGGVGAIVGIFILIAMQPIIAAAIIVPIAFIVCLFGMFVACVSGSKDIPRGQGIGWQPDDGSGEIVSECGQYRKPQTRD